MLNVNQLHVNYGQSEIIHDMSFSARRGETLAIMGRNGMGKTTLMKSLIGILKSTARRSRTSTAGSA
jgi:urea transport system ATP-binding protein